MDNTQEDERPEVPEEVPPDVEATRHQIEETRAEMSETIDAIEEKLAVERIKGRMEAAIRDATIGRVEQVAARLLSQARESLTRLPGLVTEHRREVVGLGTGLGGIVVLLAALMRKRRRETDPSSQTGSSTAEQSRSAGSSAAKNDNAGMKMDLVTHVADWVQSQTNQLTSSAGRSASRRRVSDTAGQVGDTVQSVAHKNLLTMFALIISAGLTGVARLLDSRRVESQPEQRALSRPLLAVAVVIPPGAAGGAFWWLRRRSQGPATTHDLLLAWLNDAYSMETALVRTLTRHANDAQGYPVIRARIAQHLEETRRHADLVKSCIERLGGTTSRVKSILGSVMGRLQGLSTAPAPDELIKNMLAEAAAENFEVASYTALAAAAQELGDDETAAVCRQILQEDEEMARWIEQSLPMMTQETLNAVSRVSE